MPLDICFGELDDPRRARGQVGGEPTNCRPASGPRSSAVRASHRRRPRGQHGHFERLIVGPPGDLGQQVVGLVLQARPVLLRSLVGRIGNGAVGDQNQEDGRRQLAAVVAWPLCLSTAAADVPMGTLVRQRGQGRATRLGSLGNVTIKVGSTDRRRGCLLGRTDWHSEPACCLVAARRP